MRPYYAEPGIALYLGDCREVLPALGPLGADLLIADPPYGETSLSWDRHCEGWLPAAAGALAASASLWCFGSLRFFMARASDFVGWRFAQDVVWEKHNGSSFHDDRFKRVHECAAQFYRGRWAAVHKSPVYTADATARTVRRKGRAPHWGVIGEGRYVSEDGGPRLMRSVLHARSCHGQAAHPTQKPEAVVRPLVEYSCPQGGLLLSPFAGSGTDLVVAKQLGLRAVGVEREERWCEAAVARLRQGVIR